MTLEINSPSNVDVMVWGCQRTIRNTFAQIIFIVSLIRHDVVYDHRTKMRLEGIKISNCILNFGNIKYTKSKVYNGEIYKYPFKYSIILKYIWIFFKNTIFNKIKKKFFYLLKFKLNHWVIYISKTNDFNKIDLENCVPIKTNKNFFFADPFYIQYKKNSTFSYL